MELRAKTPGRAKYEPYRHKTRTLPLELQHKERSLIGGLSELTIRSTKYIQTTKKYIYNRWVEDTIMIGPTSKCVIGTSPDLQGDNPDVDERIAN